MQWSDLGCFQDEGNSPADRHLCAIYEILLVMIPDDNFKILGPIPSNPVALDVSREDKNV